MMPSNPDDFYIFQFKLSPESLSKLKHPFDEEYFNILRVSAEACIKRYANSGGKIFVHQYGVVLQIRYTGTMPDGALDDTEIISFFTAQINSRSSKMMFYFTDATGWDDNEEDSLVSFFSYSQEATRLARQAYEMFVEEAKFKSETSLFPGVGYVAFENTPEFFREGLVLDI